MSTKSERNARASRVVLPIKVKVRQRNGVFLTQIIDVSVKTPNRRRKNNLPIELD